MKTIIDTIVWAAVCALCGLIVAWCVAITQTPKDPAGWAQQHARMRNGLTVEQVLILNGDNLNESIEE